MLLKEKMTKTTKWAVLFALCIAFVFAFSSFTPNKHLTRPRLGANNYEITCCTNVLYSAETEILENNSEDDLHRELLISLLNNFFEKDCVTHFSYHTPLLAIEGILNPQSAPLLI